MRKVLAGICALALAACSGPAQPNLRQAERAFTSHNYAAARLQLLALLDSHPDDRAARLLLVKTLVALGDGEGAGNAIRKLASPIGASGELAELSAEASLLRRQPDEALATLTATHSVEAGRLRGLAALQKGEVAGAVGHFDKAVAAGGNARLFADYGRLHMVSGRIAAALAMVGRANRIAPDDIDTLLIEGELAGRRGDRVRALDRYVQAVQLYPTSVAALVGQANVLADLGRVDQLQQIMTRLAVAAPYNTMVIALQARAAAAQGDWVHVKDIVQRAEAKFPSTDPTRALYAEALLRLEHADLALAQIAPLARAFPHNRAVTRLNGEALLASGDAETAMIALKPLADHTAPNPADLKLMIQAARRAEDPSASHYERMLRQQQTQALLGEFRKGDAAVRARDWAAAANVYNRILGATGEPSLVALNNMAYAQLMLGRADQALIFAKHAMAVAPSNPSVLDTMGWVMFKAGGDVKVAKGFLARALRLAPTNKAIRAHVIEVDKASA